MNNQETASTSLEFEKKFISFVGKTGLSISLLLIPPLFRPFFAVSGFILNETALLWEYSSILFIISLGLVLFSKKINLSFSFFFFVILFFIIIELFTRIYVTTFYKEVEKQELGLFANKTYEEFAKYKGHPFLAYTGNPGIDYEVGGKIKKTTEFNNMGFIGKDFVLENPSNKVRIACIGGSTTERGYPAITEYQLNKFSKDSIQFEVLNFGVSGWTSANSLTNYILNVRDFNPDYVLIHHGWNEGRIRNTPKDFFRNDYSHSLTYFHEPRIIDKIPIRISVLYRILKNKFSRIPDWVFLGDATMIKDRPKTEENYSNSDELIPFERNIKTIVDMCLLYDSKVILSTQPFSLSKNDPTSETIEQANNIMRTIYSEYKSKVLFLDLDNSATGNMNTIFTDLAHMNSAGNFYKGSEFARFIFNDLVQKDSIRPILPYIGSFSFHNFVKRSLSNKDNKTIIKRKAQERKISTHEMLKREALYLLKQKNETQLNPIFEYHLQDYKIRNDSTWVEQIKKQAKERNISFDENIDRNIKYMLRN